MLGQLVILAHILSDKATTAQYVSHFSVENQSRAELDLKNLRTQRESRLLQVLEQAYGLARASDGDLDFSNAAEKHLWFLRPGATIRPQLAARLADAIERYAHEILASRYPLHPKFPKKLTRNTAEELVARFGEIIDADDKSITVDRDRAQMLRDFLVELGLVRVTEDRAFLRDDDILQRLENTRARKALDRPEVGEVRSWIDDTGTRGLQPDVLDLIVRCYARFAARALVSGDQPFEVKPGKEIPAYVVLERPDLPTFEVWARALARASDFGVTLAGRALHGDSLKRFEAQVLAQLDPKRQAMLRLPALLERRLAEIGQSGPTDRSTTARSAEDLASRTAGKKGKALVEALAAFEPKTSGKAVAASLEAADELCRMLDDELIWGPILQAQRRSDLAASAGLVEQVTRAMRQDELLEKLAPRLRTLAQEALRLLAPPPVSMPVDAQPVPVAARRSPPPDTGTQEIRTFPADGRGRAAVEAALDRLVTEARKALAEAPDDVEISGSLSLTWRKRP
ncbi:MAG: hypothetical protein U0359_09435 [Byssovorax sp.]